MPIRLAAGDMIEEVGDMKRYKGFYGNRQGHRHQKNFVRLMGGLTVAAMLGGCAGTAGNTTTSAGSTGSETASAQSTNAGSESSTESKTSGGEKSGSSDTLLQEVAAIQRLVDTTGADGKSASISLENRNYSLSFPEYNENYDYEGWTEADSTIIKLNGSSVEVNGSGASFANGVLTISKKGTYVLSGTLDDGQILVDAEDENVHLILNGASLNCNNGSAICVTAAKNVYISLADGTENTVSDGSYADAAAVDGAADAAIYSKADLIFNGSGSLTVQGNTAGGIHGTDDVVFREGTYTITAVEDAVKGKDMVAVYDGSFTVNAGGKGFVSTNTEEEGRGNIYVEAGSFDVTTTDDAFHSNSNVMLLGGSYKISSGDDGIHADEVTFVYGSAVEIDESYEAIEGAVVDLTQSNISLRASDDGINAAGDIDEDSGEDTGDAKGWGGFMEGNDSNVIYIDGGKLYVDAGGDGIDSNGYVYIYDGDIVVDGPENNGNGFLDCGREVIMTGGHLIAAGSTGMLETISDQSAVTAIMVGLDATQEGGTVSIQDASGNEIVSYSPQKKYQGVLFAGYDLEEGAEYTAYLNGESLGSVTISQTVNTIGTVGGMGGGPGMGGGRGMGGGHNMEGGPDVSGNIGMGGGPGMGGGHNMEGGPNVSGNTGMGGDSSMGSGRGGHGEMMRDGNFPVPSGTDKQN